MNRRTRSLFWCLGLLPGCLLLAGPSGGEVALSLGGFMTSEVTSHSGGPVLWWALGQGDYLEATLPLLYQGLPTGLEARLIDSAAGVYQWTTPFPPGLPPGRLLVEAGTAHPVFASSAHWPYLTVRREAEPPYFRKVSADLNLTRFDFGSQRAAFYDIDGDGWLDLLMQHTRVLLNRPKPGGGRHFVDFTARAGLHDLADLNGNLRAPGLSIMGDVNNDGHLDLYSGMYLDFLRLPDPPPDRGWRSAIFLNDGNGVFTEVADSGVGEHPGTECAAAFLDYDLDGCLDLTVGYFYINYGGSLRCYSQRLYKGNCDGTFTDVSAESGILTDWLYVGRPDSARPIYGVTHTDWNNDGYPDLIYCVYGRQANLHYRNNGDGTFTEVGVATGVDGDADRSDRSEPSYRQHGNTFSAGVADFNNDGFMDLLFGEITHAWAGSASDKSMLLVNLGPTEGWRFERTFRGTGRTPQDPNNWNQGDIHVGWIDFDNDRRQDVLIASGDYPDGQYLRLFRQELGHPYPGVNGWFADVTDLADFNWEGCAALSVGDYNRDGAPDIAVGRSTMRMSGEWVQAHGTHLGVFENRVGSLNHWASFRLEGKGQGFSNRQGIGARIEVTAGGETQVREIYGGCGHVGQMNAQEAYFGLGEAGVIEELRVTWPNRARRVQVWSNVPADRHFIVREGEAELVEWGR
jgi:enediyne biosynthesis protein E4